MRIQRSFIVRFGQTLLMVLLLGCSLPAVAEDSSDTFIGYRYGTRFREPNNPQEITKNIVQFAHASTYRYGSNYLNIDYFKSDSSDPASGPDSGGAVEFYLTYRHQLQYGKLTGKPLAYGGVIRDTALTAGFDLNTKNTTLAPRKQVFVVGPTVKFDVPGFLDVGLWYYRERNHCGIAPCLAPDAHSEVTFDPTYLLNATWGIPFHAGTLPLKFQGFVNFVGAKGKDYTNHETARETLMRTSLMLDVGQVVAGRKGTVFAGVGYEYWHNKYGNQPGVGTQNRAPQFQLEWHF
jgi:nucleoside-specific outer membrane channel protein Tsx